VSWQLGLARWASHLGRDLQRAGRLAGGGQSLWQAPAGALEQILRIDAALAAELVGVRRSFDVQDEVARLAADGIRHIGWGDTDYPKRLGEIVDPPFGVFTAGTGDLGHPCERPVVAIVGSRRPTSFGMSFARELASGLAARGALVVSGLALGIDAAAHAGALSAGCDTVAVLGAGVDVSSPRRNDGLRRDIVEGGLVVSEYWPGTEPAPWRFPARNRIVAGLADAVVVIEAGERSGALITAGFALEQGRPVLAVPGAPGAAASVGCNALLRAGAAMCETVDDVIDECAGRAWTDADEMTLLTPSGLDGQIFELLGREPLRPDEITLRVGVDAAAVAAALGRLELDGYVVRGQAQRYWAASLRGAA
jgi:DNA processing protein